MRGEILGTAHSDHDLVVFLEAAGLDGIEALWIGRVIRSLRRVGLEADARRIAVEAAITNGL